MCVYRLKRFGRSLFHAQTTSPISKHPHLPETFCWIRSNDSRHSRQLAVHKVTPQVVKTPALISRILQLLPPYSDPR